MPILREGLHTHTFQAERLRELAQTDRDRFRGYRCRLSGRAGDDGRSRSRSSLAKAMGRGRPCRHGSCSHPWRRRRRIGHRTISLVPVTTPRWLVLLRPWQNHRSRPGSRWCVTQSFPCLAVGPAGSEDGGADVFVQRATWRTRIVRCCHRCSPRQAARRSGEGADVTMRTLIDNARPPGICLTLVIVRPLAACALQAREPIIRASKDYCSHRPDRLCADFCKLQDGHFAEYYRRTI
jgi:hypothetical protein